jgi:hypothetical protein
VQNVINRSGNVDIVGDVRSRGAKARVLLKMSDVCIHSGNKVIQRQNVPSLGNQAIAKVRTQETRSAGNYCTHESSPEVAARDIIALAND